MLEKSYVCWQLLFCLGDSQLKITLDLVRCMCALRNTYDCDCGLNPHRQPLPFPPRICTSLVGFHTFSFPPLPFPATDNNVLTVSNKSLRVVTEKYLCLTIL